MSTTQTEYILFADETNRTPNNKYFCFAGFIISRKEYETVLIPKINKLKKKYFKRTDIIFHYTDMKNNKKCFNKFRISTFRNQFWNDFVAIIKGVNLYTIGVYFDQVLMKETYINSGTTNYDIAYRHLLENYMHFLVENNGIGAICIESRTFRENMFLERNHFNYTENGSVYYSSINTSEHLSTIEFVTKGDNCIGLQVADIIPARFMRIVNGQTDNNLLNQTFHEKMYCFGTDKENILGLKNLL